VTSKEFVDMVVDGNNVEAEGAFQHAISHKVSDALEGRRKELAASFVSTKSVETEED
tara:strand:+ start:654 stop:824 length:171 start_codon:yes stop_codon:yes gene_type:complete